MRCNLPPVASRPRPSAILANSGSFVRSKKIVSCFVAERWLDSSNADRQRTAIAMNASLATRINRPAAGQGAIGGLPARDLSQLAHATSAIDPAANAHNGSTRYLETDTPLCSSTVHNM